MTDRDLAILLEQSPATLAVWWCDLNNWEWPTALPDPEEPVYVRGGRRGQLMDWIEARIGRETVLAEHNAERFVLSIPDPRGDSEWRMTSRARTREAAMKDFARQCRDLAAVLKREQGVDLRWGFIPDDLRPGGTPS